MYNPLIYTIGTLLKSGKPYKDILNNFIYAINNITKYIQAVNVYQVIPYILYYNNLNLIYEHTNYIDDFVKFFNKCVFYRRNKEQNLIYEGNNEVCRLLVLGNNKPITLQENFEQYNLCKKCLQENDFKTLVEFNNLINIKYHEDGDFIENKH